jgi:hypothetical protein
MSDRGEECPKGEKGYPGEPGVDSDAEAAARRAGDAFVNALGNEPSEGKKWYDAPSIRNIKLGTIAAILMAIGAAIKAYWDPTPTPDPKPDNPVVVGKDNPPPVDKQSEADGWTRTTTPTVKMTPVFGVPELAPGCKREWRVVQGDPFWYFRDVPE